MSRILLMLLGTALLVPTAVIFLMYLRAGSDGGPVAFGIWMFFGLPTMVGAILAFRKAAT